jgi:hypothetical protein
VVDVPVDDSTRANFLFSLFLLCGFPGGLAGVYRLVAGVLGLALPPVRRYGGLGTIVIALLPWPGVARIERACRHRFVAMVKRPIHLRDHGGEPLSDQVQPNESVAKRLAPVRPPRVSILDLSPMDLGKELR